LQRRYQQYFRNNVIYHVKGNNCQRVQMWLSQKIIIAVRSLASNWFYRPIKWSFI